MYNKKYVIPIFIVSVIFSYFLGYYTNRKEIVYFSDNPVESESNNDLNNVNDDVYIESNKKTDEDKIENKNNKKYENIDYILNNKEKIKEEIKERALEEYQDNYRMAKHEMESQNENLEYILKNINNMDKDILEKALSEYQDNYRMAKHEYESQLESKESLDL